MVVKNDIWRVKFSCVDIPCVSYKHYKTRYGERFVIKGNKPTWVYKIECEPTKRVYIGTSIDPNKRIKGHYCTLRRGTHYNKDLQNDFNRYGAGAFNFEILGCGHQTNYMEGFFQHLYKSYDPQYGYNTHDQKWWIKGTGKRANNEFTVRGDVKCQG